MTVHLDQVASTLRRAIQQIISRGLNDPRVSGMVSVTAVHVSEDLAAATVSVSVLPAEKADVTLHGLHHAASHIRYQLSKAVRLRRTPRLTFKLDETLKREARVIAAINEARRRDAQMAPPAEPPPPSAEEPNP